MIRKLCIDLGNGNTKGAEVVITHRKRKGEVIETRELQTASLPSQVGAGDTSLGGLSLGNVVKRRKEEQPAQVSFSGGTYLVGHNVARFAKPLERFDLRKYTDSMEVRALTYALLAQMVNGGETDMALIVALPVEVVMAEAFKETAKGIEEWLLGEHHFTYDGHVSHLTVHAIKCMAQPVGAFFAWGLDDHGDWTMRSEDDLLNANVAVLDSGFNTLDLLLVKQGRIEKRFTGGDTLGVRVAAEEIARGVKAQYQFDLSMAEADTYIRQYLDRKSVPIIVAGEKHDLAPLVRQALNALSTRTIRFVEETWRGAQLSYVLLAGGGAMVLDAPLRRQMRQAELLPDPVTANAIGLAKLAQRPGVFKGLPE